MGPSPTISQVLTYIVEMQKVREVKVKLAYMSCYNVH